MVLTYRFARQVNDEQRQRETEHEEAAMKNASILLATAIQIHHREEQHSHNETVAFCRPEHSENFLLPASMALRE